MATLPNPLPESSASVNRPEKPAKPSPDYPLYPHGSGQWAKKIRGTTYYFGLWSDPKGALRNYEAKRAELESGRTVKEDTELTVKALVNHFLNAKQDRIDTGELSPRTWVDYKAAADEVIREFGKTRLVSDLSPKDFTALRNRLAKRFGPHRLAKFVVCIRMIFKSAFDAGLLDVPMHFGVDFKRPSKKTFRLHKAAKGPRLYSREEILRMLDTASQPLKAMILLGINCGLGNADVGRLPLSALGLETGWMDYPRPKTGIARRCPLWPETVQAIREALAVRPQPKTEEYAAFVFITVRGLRPWSTSSENSPVCAEFRKLMRRLGINGTRGFYCLRHTFCTIADGAKDPSARDHIMGHEVAHMSSVYCEGIDDERLLAVGQHVHTWLFRTS
jgi:integrase